MSMTKLLIHSDSLSLRGDSTNAESISTYLKLLFDIDSVIVAPHGAIQNSHLRIKDMKERGLSVILYESKSQLENIAKIESVSHSYFFTSGKYSNLWIPDTKHLVHAVFNWFEPYGDVYAYVSQWLHRKAVKDKRCRDVLEIEAERAITNSPYSLSKKTKVTWVPHTIVAKHGDGNRFRNKYAISKKYKIVGRIGGFDQFNDKAAILGVIRVLKKRQDIVFVFVNTRKFVEHPQVIYLDSLANEDKWDFYDAGVLFLNGRAMGETFGFSIVEPLTVGKPVIAPDRIRHLSMDAAHMEILRPLCLTYLSSIDFACKVLRIVDENIDKELLCASVSQFSPENSMKRFVSEFLQLNT